MIPQHMSRFESLPEHVQKPALRPIQPIPVQKDGQVLLALRDPAMICRQTVVVSHQALQILRQFRGEVRLDELADRTGGDLGQLVELCTGLDKVGLLWGPNFEKMEQELHGRIREAGTFEARATTSLGPDAAGCRQIIDRYLDETEDPELDVAPTGLVAPHLDYARGWPNYAAAYHCARNMERPDRVVILGTNHFGLGDGVVMTEYAFQTPLGTCPVDGAVVDQLIRRLGRGVVADQLDHLPEHSVELQLPWLQYLFGNVPIVPVLVADPLNETLPGDDARVTPQQFNAVLRETIHDADGRTFILASADLSHVGPEFGEPLAVDDQRRVDVERLDREMLGRFLSGDAEDFLAAMRWNRNPTRWCSIGNMSSILAILEPERVELLDYRQACDEHGRGLVSSAALALA